jgi:hypothetical protein
MMDHSNHKCHRRGRVTVAALRPHMQQPKASQHTELIPVVDALFIKRESAHRAMGWEAAQPEHAFGGVFGRLVRIG